MPNIPVKDCCGCTACASICPANAIRMQPDQEGFLQPVVDDSLCYSCNCCEAVCPIINPPAISKVFEACVVAQSKDTQVLNESTSGGFVDALCKYVLEENEGYACGVAFDSEFMPHHKIVDSYEAAKAFRNSKYAQSDLGMVFQDLRNLLKIDKWVLFIGTPCQVAGLKSFLDGNNEEKLITVDLVCRSIPSRKLWRMYLDWQQLRHGAPIKKIVCRKKTYGYHSGALEIDFENGRHYAGSNRVDYYMKSFHKDICSRRSCYNCHFKTEHRCSDFTVFDSWRPDLATNEVLSDNDKGYSSVIAHTKKGKHILCTLKDIIMHDAQPEKVLEHTGGMAVTSVVLPAERESFYLKLDRYGFYETAKQVHNIGLVDCLIERAKPVWYRIRSYFKRMR